MKPDAQSAGFDWADLLAGLGVAAISGTFAYIALRYGLGTLRHVGAGFFPFVLGALGIALGLFIAARAVLRPAGQHTTLHGRAFAFIIASVVCFALTIQTAGLMATIVLTTLVASFADRASRPLQTLLLGIGLAVGIWLVFVVLLRQPIPVWPRLN